MKKKLYSTGVVKVFIFIFNLSKTMEGTTTTVVCSLRGARAVLAVSRGTLRIWSLNNLLADTLSRLDKDVVLPPLLTKVPRGEPRRDGFLIIGLTFDEELAKFVK